MMKIIRNFLLAILMVAFSLGIVLPLLTLIGEDQVYSILGGIYPMLWLLIFIECSLFLGKFAITLISILIALLPIIGCLMLKVNAWIYRFCVYIPLCATMILNGNNLNLNAVVIVCLIIAILADLCNEK